MKVEANAALHNTLVCVEDNSTKMEDHSSIWVIDSATTKHISLEKRLITSFIEGNHNLARVENGRVFKTSGTEDICLKTDNESEQVLQDIGMCLLSKSILSQEVS